MNRNIPAQTCRILAMRANTAKDHFSDVVVWEYLAESNLHYRVFCRSMIPGRRLGWSLVADASDVGNLRSIISKHHEVVVYETTGTLTEGHAPDMTAKQASRKEQVRINSGLRYAAENAGW